ncbi:calaxin-like [Periplaneta americana]|uniref:calaxin-like n=1 Tax=Periplaneta americana TaxID=6978 RepID=UPI0037E8DDEA
MPTPNKRCHTNASYLFVSFQVYDAIGDGHILKDNMFHLMHKFVVLPSYDEVDEVVTDMVEVLMKKMDVDLDGKISFEDFKTSVHKCPLLLEAMGQCVPTRSSIHDFLTTFSRNVGRF